MNSRRYDRRINLGVGFLELGFYYRCSFSWCFPRKTSIISKKPYKNTKITGAFIIL